MKDGISTLAYGHYQTVDEEFLKRLNLQERRGGVPYF